MKRAARGNCGEATYGQSCGAGRESGPMFSGLLPLVHVISLTPFASSHVGATMAALVWGLHFRG